MQLLLLLPLLLLPLCPYLLIVAATPTFSEQLLIRPLEDGNVLTHFEFTVSCHSQPCLFPLSHSACRPISPSPLALYPLQMTVDALPSAHYVLFPKSLGQVISEFGVERLHLSLSAGRWRHSKWGYSQSPPFPLPSNASSPPSPLAGPSGAELFVTLSTSPHLAPPLTRHSALLSALTGLICASFNRIDATRTSHPTHLYPPTPGASFYSTLPRENVCTENLTPLIKLLPCRNRRGLASLLHSLRLFRSSYHSLQLHYHSHRLTLVFMAVVDPRVWTQADTPSWTVQALFDEAAATRCPVAADSRVWLHLQSWVSAHYGAEAMTRLADAHAGDSPEHLSVTPQWTARYWEGGEGGELLVWDLAAFPHGLGLAMQHRTQRPETLAVPIGGEFVSRPAVLAQRYLTGTDSYTGQLYAELYNHDSDRAHTVVFFDTIPSALTPATVTVPDASHSASLTVAGAVV